MPELTFDAATHTYRWDGQIVLSVTQALREAGLMPPYASLSAAERGRKVHRACELLDRGGLNFATLDERLAGWVMAYDRFKQETGMKMELIEHRVFHPERIFAGTLDRVGLLNGCRVLLDIKTGEKAAWHGPQLSGYSMCLNNGLSVKKRFGLYLNEDWSYDLVPYEDAADEGVFLAALAVAQWKRAHR